MRVRVRWGSLALAAMPSDLLHEGNSRHSVNDKSNGFKNYTVAMKFISYHSQVDTSMAMKRQE